MARILQVPMTTSFPCSSSSSSSSLKRRSFTRTISAVNSAKIPLSPINPKDPFLSKLASVVVSSPEILLNRPPTSDTPPYLDIFDSPELMATPATVERSVSYNEDRPRRPPPDLPSLLLHGRTVYIGMPLVPAVTELVIAELMYLQWMDPKESIFLYINSTGTTRDDGETVGMETEGFAIYDAMMQLKKEIHTVAVGAAIGQACLLLAAGSKGKRFMMPHAKAMIQQPRAPSSGLLPASDVFIRAKEVPDVEGSKEDKCELTRTPYSWRFINEELNSYIEFLFEMIVARGLSLGLNFSLNRFDLFHGHLFIAVDSGRLGILFHAKEYPAYEKDVFPCNLGYCQTGSNVTYDDSMNFRNILWLAPLPSNSSKSWLAPGVLVVLDAHPEGIIYQDLIPEYVNFARTLYEDDFGEVVVDVNYLNVGAKVPKYQLFIC